MTSGNTLMQELSDQQVENEWFFVCSLYANGASVAVQELSWLEPLMFVDETLGLFWDRVKQHGDTLRAINEAKVDQIELSRWVVRTPTLTREDEYARMIVESYYYRNVLKNMLEMAKAVSSRDLPKVQEISEKLHAIVPRGGIQAFTSTQISAEFIPELNKVHVGSILTMIPEFDGVMGGLFPSELTVLAGRPGMGKTAYALQTARNVAVSGKKVLFLSLEMSRMQLWARMACGDAGYEWKDIRAGKVDQVGLQAIARASNALQKLLGDNLLIHDEVWTLQEIQQVAAFHKPDLVIIDHLGEITRNPADMGDIEWYPRAVKYIRRYITRRMKIPTILIHQLNRGVEARDDKRPLMSDLRASGEIEQLADIVLMCYRDDYYNDAMSHLTRVPFELLVRKNRQGTMNATMNMVYDLRRQWFDGVSPMSP